MQIDQSNREVQLSYLKQGSDHLYYGTNEKSWETLTVVKGILHKPDLVGDKRNRRKLVYKFQSNMKMI